MSTFYLINTVYVGTQKYFAGEKFDDSKDDTAGIAAAGGILWPSADSTVSAQAALVQTMRSNRAIDEAKADQLMQAAASYSAHLTTAGATGATGTTGATGATGPAGATGATGAP